MTCHAQPQLARFLQHSCDVCPHCRYCLHALAFDRCPECGLQLSIHSIISSRPLPFRHFIRSETLWFYSLLGLLVILTASLPFPRFWTGDPLSDYLGPPVILLLPIGPLLFLWNWAIRALPRENMLCLGRLLCPFIAFTCTIIASLVLRLLLYIATS